MGSTTGYLSGRLTVTPGALYVYDYDGTSWHPFSTL